MGALQNGGAETGAGLDLVLPHCHLLCSKANLPVLCRICLLPLVPFFFLSFLLNILCDILPALLMLILSHFFSLTQMIENCCLKEGGPGAEIPFLFLSIQSLGLVFLPNQIATFSTVSASVSEPSEMTFPNAMLHMDAGSLFLMFNHMPYALLAARLLP